MCTHQPPLPPSHPPTHHACRHAQDPAEFLEQLQRFMGGGGAPMRSWQQGGGLDPWGTSSSESWHRWAPWGRNTWAEHGSAACVDVDTAPQTGRPWWGVGMVLARCGAMQSHSAPPWLQPLLFCIARALLDPTCGPQSYFPNPRFLRRRVQEQQSNPFGRGRPSYAQDGDRYGSGRPEWQPYRQEDDLLEKREGFRYRPGGVKWGPPRRGDEEEEGGDGGRDGRGGRGGRPGKGPSIGGDDFRRGMGL